MKKKLDFYIVGAHKAASTSLYYHLRRHPNLFLPSVEENRFFTKDEFFQQGEKYLEPYYKEWDDEEVVGGKSVHVMYLGNAIDRVWKYNPEMKIIAILRDPIDRAYSAYWFARSRGWESCQSFEKALQLEPERREGAYDERTELTYLTHGLYAEQLERIINLFGWDNIFICLTKDLRDNTEDVLRDIFSWLSVRPYYQGMGDSIKRNQSSMPKLLGLQRFVMVREAWYRKLIRETLPLSVRVWLQDKIVDPFIQWNQERFDYPPMSSETRQQLSEYFKPHNERLENLIGRDLSHWQ